MGAVFDDADLWLSTEQSLTGATGLKVAQRTKYDLEGDGVAPETTRAAAQDIVAELTERGVIRDLETPIEVVGEAVAACGGAGCGGAGGAAITQVSLLPPPCDELTTSDPCRKATRVSPPGKTKISSPYKIYGRKSTCRPSNLPSIIVGIRDNDKVGCAM